MASLYATPLLLFTLLLLLPWDASADVCKKVECGKELFNFVPCQTPNCVMDCIELGFNFNTTKPPPRPTLSRRSRAKGIETAIRPEVHKAELANDLRTYIHRLFVVGLIHYPNLRT
nr:hypothetical protein Iba_chr13cCG5850 [Ipomoea batatas]